MPDDEGESHPMEALRIAMQAIIVISSLLLILLVLLHKGKGSGLSDMFGGGVSSNLGGSSVAEKNLNRLTVIAGVVWAVSIVGLGLVVRFS